MILITVKLFNTNPGKTLADTAVYNLSIVKEAGKMEYVYNIPLKVEKSIEYMAEIKILDRLRLIVVQAFVPFNTLSILPTNIISECRDISLKISFSIRF